LKKPIVLFAAFVAALGFAYVASDHHDLNPGKENLWCPHQTQKVSRPTVPISGEQIDLDKGFDRIAEQFKNAVPLRTTEHWKSEKPELVRGDMHRVQSPRPLPTPIVLAAQHKERPLPFPGPTPQQFGQWHTE
jgi:hypothetical protein